MKKAQMSMEFLFAIGLIFLIFLMLLAVIVERQYDTRISKLTLEKLSECQRVANIITALASSNDGTKVEINTGYYLNVFYSGIIFANDNNSTYNEVSCTYVANPLNLSLNGIVKLQKIGGIVSAYQ